MNGPIRKKFCHLPCAQQPRSGQSGPIVDRVGSRSCLLVCYDNSVKSRSSGLDLLLAKLQHNLFVQPWEKKIRRAMQRAMTPDIAAQTDRGIDENTDFSDLTDQQILALTQGASRRESYNPLGAVLTSTVPSQIKDEHSHTRALIGSAEPIEELRKEYERGTPVFVQKIDWLKKHDWSHIRRRVLSGWSSLLTRELTAR